MAFSSSQASKGVPPDVVFEYRPVEDRDASIKAGRRVSRDEIFALIRLPRSNDMIELKAEDWVAQLAIDARDGRYPRDWAEGFAEYLEDWKRRHEIPPTGFAIRHWAVVDRSTAEMLLDANILTVEQLAEAADKQLDSIAGGADLREQALAWFVSAQDSGKAASEIAALRADAENLRMRNAELEAKVGELEAALVSAADRRLGAGRMIEMRR